MADNDRLIEMAIPRIQGMEEILKPSDRPVMGKQRLVRFLPAVPGMEERFPCIWTSPYTVKGPLEEGGPGGPSTYASSSYRRDRPKPEIVGDPYPGRKDLDKFDDGPGRMVMMTEAA